MYRAAAYRRRVRSRAWRLRDRDRCFNLAAGFAPRKKPLEDRFTIFGGIPGPSSAIAISTMPSCGRLTLDANRRARRILDRVVEDVASASYTSSRSAIAVAAVWVSISNCTDGASSRRTSTISAISSPTSNGSNKRVSSPSSFARQHEVVDERAACAVLRRRSRKK